MVDHKLISYKEQTIFFVGIKGSGMAALAVLLKSRGFKVTGSDVDDVFFTDQFLNNNHISYGDFAPERVDEAGLVIYSAAYDPQEHPQLLRAVEKKIPILVYPEALGSLSRDAYSVAVSGIHGKTTTTALIGSMVKETNLSASLLVGSLVNQFNNSQVWTQGSRIFIAETCEYRRHFLHFNPSLLLITSLEEDHLDYFKDLDDIKNAFEEFCNKLPAGGTIIYCHDDNNLVQFIEQYKKNRRDIIFIPYGFSAKGKFKITESYLKSEKQEFFLEGFYPRWILNVPGTHNVLNAAGAIAVLVELYKKEEISLGTFDLELWRQGLASFNGTKRRAEIIGNVDNILFMDDYAHHPTALKKTIGGLREFYPDRRIIVDFMSHTYSRTESLLQDFSTAFTDADIVILHKIYASAREKKGNISGETLWNEVKKHHSQVSYYQEPEEALNDLKSLLQPGDLFVTMGAGNNWEIGPLLLEAVQKGVEHNE